MADNADNSMNLDKTLEQLITQGQDPALKFGTSQMQITRTGDVDTNRMVSIFSDAFPDMNFEAFTDEEGKKGLRSIDKPRVQQTSIIPTGYSPKLADKGIDDLKTALESETDIEKKYEIASRLNTLVQTQRAYKFGEYKQRAETEFGVPELEQAIESVRQAELRSPYNPGTGLPSQQRMVLIQQLASVRSTAGRRIQEYMSNDPALAGAEALAKGTIAEISGKIQLEGRTEHLDTVRQAKEARAAAISSMDPSFIDSASIVARGYAPSSPEERLNFAGQIYDKKVSLNQIQSNIATATPEALVSMYMDNKDAKIRPMILNVLKAHEKNVVGNDAEAERNMGLFSKLIDRNFSENDPTTSPAIKQKLKQISTEVNSQGGQLSSQERDSLTRSKVQALKRSILADTIKTSMYEDMSQWNGLVRSDDTARAVLDEARQKKERLTFPAFVDRYISFNDGKQPADKSGAIQSMVVSAMESLPRSVVLPIPSPESFQLEAQRIVASRLLDNRLKRFGVDNPFRNW